MRENYVPSGIFPPASFLIALLATMVFSLILAIPYALAIWFIPIAFISILAPIAWGFLCSLIPGRTITSGHIRNPMVAGLAGFLGSLPGYYLTWCAWANLVFNMGDTVAIGSGRRAMSVAKSSISLDQLKELALVPKGLFSLIQSVNEVGLWSISRSSGNVHGLPLWGVWGVEFLMIVGVTAFLYAARAREPYSEETQRWIPCLKLGQKLAFPDDLAQLRQKLDDGDINYLLSAPVEEDIKNSNYLALSVYQDAAITEAYLDVDAFTLEKKNAHKSNNLSKKLKIRTDLARALVNRLS
ncbi:MAG: hypothetical protein LBR11_07030 [Deltaproteobacteria bacterium]|jgi:hypothetical protein|nr:hypothetical protein [Deltaproteobacteria bacterium]